MISRKVRNNASITYFFLGWLFLLAKNNPNFADPFIKKHAKTATQGHVLFFLGYFFYSYFLSEFFSYSIPVIQITLDHCMSIAFFAFITLFIIRGVHRSQKDESIEVTENQTGFFSIEGRVFGLSGASETEKTILLLAHIPFISMIISKKYPNIATITGARISSILGCIYLISFIVLGFGALSMILLFILIILFLYLAARFFLYDNYTIPVVLERIPSAILVYEIVRAIPPYIVDICRMIFGKQKSVSLQSHINNIREKDQNSRIMLQEFFTDNSLPFQSFWIFIPFVNLVFIPKLFTSRTTRYVTAIGQGFVITLFALIIGVVSLFPSSFGLLLLFPVFYGIASLESDVFVRIPLVYEVYAILNTFTFGLLNNTKRIKAVQKQDTAVSYKVE